VNSSLSEGQHISDTFIFSEKMINARTIKSALKFRDGTLLRSKTFVLEFFRNLFCD